ncbi:MAG: hypothetical protein ACOH1T_01360 [Microbacteriaceae bacterium]
MRFVLAIVSFVVAALAIGLGFAQKTVFALPNETSANITAIDTGAKVTIIDGSTLNANPRSQTVAISGAPKVFAAYGRTSDIMAFVGSASYNSLKYDTETGRLKNTFTEGTDEEITTAEGSDLWYLDYAKENDLRITINVPADVSLIIMSDGVEPAPSRVALTWPVDNSTPWATPLIIGGAIVLLFGLGMLFWAVHHVHSARGPRRKQQKMPKLPRQPRYKPSRVRPKALGVGGPKAIDSSPRGRRSSRTGMIAALPVVLVASLALSGCSADFWAGRGIPDAPVSATPEVAADEGAQLETPAVTAPQAKRIISRIAAVALEADEAKDPTLIASRFAGPALDLRVANYKMRKADKKITALTAIPTDDFRVILPQQSDSWPRTVFAVVENFANEETKETNYFMSLVMIQDDPRSQYKVHYAMALEPGAVIPKVAAANVGTGRVGEEIGLFTIPPAELALAYADVLTLDTESEWADLFAVEGDSFRTEVGLAAKKALQKKLPSTAKLTFENSVGPGQVVALPTADQGALVAVNLNETQVVKSVETGAAVNAPKAVKALLGKSLSTKGLRAVYGDQLLFYVPSLGSGDKIQLLGYSQGLISASELK